MGLFGVELDFNNVVAIVSVAIPVLAFFWEFVVIRRKRLGYRLQMDTLATDTAHAPSASGSRAWRSGTASSPATTT